MCRAVTKVLGFGGSFHVGGSSIRNGEGHGVSAHGKGKGFRQILQRVLEKKQSFFLFSFFFF